MADAKYKILEYKPEELEEFKQWLMLLLTIIGKYDEYIDVVDPHFGGGTATEIDLPVSAPIEDAEYVSSPLNANAPPFHHFVQALYVIALDAKRANYFNLVPNERWQRTYREWLAHVVDLRKRNQLPPIVAVQTFNNAKHIQYVYAFRMRMRYVTLDTVKQYAPIYGTDLADESDDDDCCCCTPFFDNTPSRSAIRAKTKVNTRNAHSKRPLLDRTSAASANPYANLYMNINSDTADTEFADSVDAEETTQIFGGGVTNGGLTRKARAATQPIAYTSPIFSELKPTLQFEYAVDNHFDFNYVPATIREYDRFATWLREVTRYTTLRITTGMYKDKYVVWRAGLDRINSVANGKAYLLYLQLVDTVPETDGEFNALGTSDK